MASFSGIDATMLQMRNEIEKLRKEGIEEVAQAAIVAVTAMMEITPVNTGETVRNYAAGKGSRPQGLTKAPSIVSKQPTNELAMGAEDNRPGNEAAAMGEVRAAVTSDPKTLATVYITNTIDDEKWGLIDSGFAPGPPWQSRGPGGQQAVGEAAVRGSRAGRWK